MFNTPDSPAKTPGGYTTQGGNFWTLITPEIWKVLHAVLHPQGLTGNSSVMGVNIESSARHPSTIGVAVNTGCWAHRRGKIRINPDMSYEIISHEGVVL
jgi:hypothetical protein